MHPPTDPRLWLLRGDKPTGPFTPEDVRARLAAGDVSMDTLACPVGGSEWRPLARTEGFELPPPPPPPPVTPPPPAPAGTELPTFGRLVVAYCLAVNPILWVTFQMSCCVTGATYRQGSSFAALDVVLEVTWAAAGLLIAGVLAWGGWRLHTAGLSASRPAQGGLALSVGASALKFLMSLAVALAAAAQPVDQFAEATPAGAVVTFLLIPVALGAWAFEVAALVWLSRFGPPDGASPPDGAAGATAPGRGPAADAPAGAGPKPGSASTREGARAETWLFVLVSAAVAAPVGALLGFGVWALAPAELPKSKPTISVHRPAGGGPAPVPSKPGGPTLVLYAAGAAGPGYSASAGAALAALVAAYQAAKTSRAENKQGAGPAGPGPAGGVGRA